MRLVGICLAGVAAASLAGCGNAKKQQIEMVKCSGFIGGIGDTDLSSTLLDALSAHGRGFDWIAGIGQTGGLYYQQIDPAKAAQARQQGAEEAHRLAERNDVKGAVAFLERCDRTRSQLAK